MTTTKKQCKGYTIGSWHSPGKRCVNQPSPSGYCYHHDPVRLTERAEIRWTKLQEKKLLHEASVALRDALMLIAHGCDKPKEFAEDVLRSRGLYSKSKKEDLNKGGKWPIKKTHF